MMIYSANFNGSNRNFPGGGLGCLVFGILGLTAVYFIIKGLYILLYWLSPALFVAALVINWKAVADTGTYFLGLLQRNPVGAVLLGVICAVAFPFFALYLLLKALAFKRIQNMKSTFEAMRDQSAYGPQANEGDYIDYEVLDDDPGGPVQIPTPPARQDAKEPKG